jgi:hypothetical protein
LYFVRDKKVVGVFVRFRAPLPEEDLPWDVFWFWPLILAKNDDKVDARKSYFERC